VASAVVRRWAPPAFPVLGIICGIFCGSEIERRPYSRRGLRQWRLGAHGAMLPHHDRGPFMSFSDDPRMDREIYDLTAANVLKLSRLSASTGIDCDLDADGTLQVCNSEADAESARAYVSRAKTLGMPGRILGAPTAVRGDRHRGVSRRLLRPERRSSESP